MQMRRVCLILSAILFAVNVLFFVMYKRTERELTTLSDPLIDDAAAFFSARGCEVSPDVIVRQIPDAPVYAVNSASVEQTAREIAGRLCRSDNDGDVTTVETPDGLICRAGAGKEPCVFRLSYDAFGFSYAADPESQTEGLSEAIVPYFETHAAALVGNEAKTVSAFMKRLLGKQGADYGVYGRKSENGTTVLCVGQNIGDLPLRGCYACLTIENERVVNASGRLLFGGNGKKYRETLTDGVNALRAVGVGENGSVSVEDEHISYEVRYTDDGECYLVPVWEIRTVTKDGENTVLVIDAIGGTM